MVSKNDVILHGQYFSHAKTYLLIMHPMFCEQNVLYFKQLLVEFWYSFYDSNCFYKSFLKTLHKNNCQLLAL